MSVGFQIVINIRYGTYLKEKATHVIKYVLKSASCINLYFSLLWDSYSVFLTKSVLNAGRNNEK